MVELSNGFAEHAEAGAFGVNERGVRDGRLKGEKGGRVRGGGQG